MPESNDPLWQLFEEIDDLKLKSMKERREEESFNLDFKRMDPSGEPSEDDKRNLRIAISGFANAAGGMLLWGVESKRPDDRRDRSRFNDFAPIINGDRAVVRFHELTGVATQPPVSGVVHKAIAIAGGYIVKSFVPASDGGPHRTNEERGQYYRRDADAFRPMQHHEIADMFGRRARPRLSLWRSDLQRPGLLDHGGRRATADVRIGIRNDGRGIARFPRIVIRPVRGVFSECLFGLDGNGARGLTRRPSAEGVKELVFAGGGDDVVHPSSHLEVCALGLEAAGPDESRSVALSVLIYAAEMEPVETQLAFTERELVAGSREEPH